MTLCALSEKATAVICVEINRKRDDKNFLLYLFKYNKN